eukprot:scaffold359889_cov19-Prasinocladus_malaysianus.AAC.1
MSVSSVYINLLCWQIYQIVLQVPIVMYRIVRYRPEKPMGLTNLEALPLGAGLPHPFTTSKVNQAELAVPDRTGDEILTGDIDGHDEVASGRRVVHLGGARGPVGAASPHESHKVVRRGDDFMSHVGHHHTAIFVGLYVMALLISTLHDTE